MPDSTRYCQEAVSRMSRCVTQSQDLDDLRSLGLLAVYSFRCNNHDDLARYTALYHTTTTQHSFHDENRLPNDISLSEVDDRRRLFWCFYRLEVHSSCIPGHVVRMPESQASVFYPRITTLMDPETRGWTAG